MAVDKGLDKIWLSYRNANTRKGCNTSVNQGLKLNFN